MESEDQTYSSATVVTAELVEGSIDVIEMSDGGTKDLQVGTVVLSESNIAPAERSTVPYNWNVILRSFIRPCQANKNEFTLPKVGV